MGGGGSTPSSSSTVRTVYVPRPDSPPPPTFDKPWRKGDWDKRNALLKSVKDYSREDEDVKLIRILLHGPIGSGKSSFVNSVSSCLRGRMSHGAHVDNMGGTSYTLQYKTHKIKKVGRDFYPFVFNDIMGLEAEHGIQKEDIKLAMKGRVKDGYTFNPVAALSEKSPEYNPAPTPEDKIHVLVCVVPADQVAVLHEGVVKKLRNIRKAASALDIPQVCIITKIDEADRFMSEDVKNVYKMKIVKEKMEEFSTRVGIPMTEIFPVKNYHNETEVDNDVDVLLLKAVQHMINLGEDFIDNM